MIERELLDEKANRWDGGILRQLKPPGGGISFSRSANPSWLGAHSRTGRAGAVVNELGMENDTPKSKTP